MTQDSARLAALLEKYAEYRSEYLHVPEPQHSGDIDAMKPTDLLLWAECESFRHAAKVLREPTENYLSLPSWRWDEWLQFVAAGDA